MRFIFWCSQFLKDHQQVKFQPFQYNAPVNQAQPQVSSCWWRESVEGWVDHKDTFSLKRRNVAWQSKHLTGKALRAKLPPQHQPAWGRRQAVRADTRFIMTFEGSNDQQQDGPSTVMVRFTEH